MDILRIMDETGALIKSKISKDLSINEEILDDLIKQLIRMNYLKEDLGSPTCQTKCSSCPLSSCNSTPVKMYKITPKGKKLLNN